MGLPNGNRAQIDPAKLTEYLLKADHPDGGGKATFFEALGYSQNHPSVLGRDLVRIARTGRVRETILTSHGTKYVVDGTATSPSGRAYFLRTVWMIESIRVEPRFITAYPRPP